MVKFVVSWRSLFSFATADGCKHCPPGWFLINSVCYYFSSSVRDGHKTWQKAREFCQVHGGDLLIIDSKDKEVGFMSEPMDHSECDGFFFFFLVNRFYFYFSVLECNRKSLVKSPRPLWSQYSLLVRVERFSWGRNLEVGGWNRAHWRVRIQLFRQWEK